MYKLGAIILMSLASLVAVGNAASVHGLLDDGVTAPASFKPAIIFETGLSESDRGFTQAAITGAEKARKDMGIQYQLKRITDEAKRKTAIEEAAAGGYNPVIAVGFQNVLPVLELAEKFPATRFTVIDGIVPPHYNNVQSINFKDHEGAFLVGMIAAYKSKTGTVGFIGGMDVPLIRNFATGYKQGAQYAKPNIKVEVEMIGNAADAWSNPARGAQLADKQIGLGADVIFAAAGGSGIGVLKAAAESGNYGIGVDANQNGLFPGHVLTSMVKRVDLAVYDALKNSYEGTWEPGIKYLGIREYVLDYAVDKYNKNLITKEMIDKVEDAKDKITNGLLDVEIYSPN